MPKLLYYYECSYIRFPLEEDMRTRMNSGEVHREGAPERRVIPRQEKDRIFYPSLGETTINCLLVIR
jgi:hypothetical protein